MYPEKMSALPGELFKSLMASLEVGLTKYPYLLVGSSSPLVLTSGAQTGLFSLTSPRVLLLFLIKMLVHNYLSVVP